MKARSTPGVQQGIVELTEYRLDVRDALLGARLDDVLEKLLVDLDRVQLAARPDRARQRQAEDSGAGADVGDQHARLELQRGDHFRDLQALEPLRRVECFHPLLGRPVVPVRLCPPAAGRPRDNAWDAHGSYLVSL